jgi:hypothetical protein
MIKIRGIGVAGVVLAIATLGGLGGVSVAAAQTAPHNAANGHAALPPGAKPGLPPGAPTPSGPATKRVGPPPAGFPGKGIVNHQVPLPKGFKPGLPPGAPTPSGPATTTVGPPPAGFPGPAPRS